MNSEELEQSLRAEFENYLKGVVAEMRQGVSDFQEKIIADFEKHKEQLDTSFRELNEQFGKEKELELSFTDSVAEHLKLAKDEGARITATAIADAEELREEPEPVDFSDLRNAMNDISKKDSQSEILKALVNHASEFTSRGAFFIVKNEHLVGWRVFGREEHEDPQAVREVFFPVASNTALSESVEQLKTISETQPDSEDDVMYRTRLGFEDSEQMYAIPLIARGRGVAVLYADTGTTGDPVNVSAIEALMCVAGLTVEVLASAPPVPREQEVYEEAPAPAVSHEQVATEEAAVPKPAADYLQYEDKTAEFESDQEAEALEEETEFAEPAAEFEAPTDEVADEEPDAFQFQPVVSPVVEFDAPEAEAEADDFEDLDSGFEAPSTEFADTDADEAGLDEPTPSFEAEEWDQPVSSPSTDFSDSFDSEFADSTEEASEFEAYDSEISESYVELEAEEPASDLEFEPADEVSSFDGVDETESELEFDSVSEESSFDAAEEIESEVEYDAAPDPAFEETVEAPADEVTAFDSFEDAPSRSPAPEPETAPVEAAVPTVRPRFADRNLDLPIEVGEDERRLHNDARRFARLLVSEIKLYNEQKVKEGRESNDLYERLREAIDRSREMYDKRVQPPVAAKFDYFNYELVNTLAEGDEGKLGGSYPGPAI